MPGSPRQSNKNVPLPPGFGERLRELREERNLSKTDLADAAGTTYRTVQNIETDKQHVRAQEKTLMGIAAALGLTFAELMQNGSAEPDLEAVAAATAAEARPARRRKTTWGILAGLLLVLATSLWYAGGVATSRADWDFTEGHLTARDAVLGVELWHHRFDSWIKFCKPAAWDESLLLVGLNARSADGGRLLALDRATGRLQWEMAPDMAQMTRSLGAGILAAANMACGSLDFLDVDGDGQWEMFVNFNHGLYYPTALCLVGRNGRLLAQYTHKGHLYNTLVADLDHDGKDEAVAAGVNNDPSSNGPAVVLLDDQHWRGASVDSLCNPWSSEPDSALARLAFPRFAEPYQSLLCESRAYVDGLATYQQPDGRQFLNLHIESDLQLGRGLAVQTDDRLHVLGALAKDGLKAYITHDWPDSLQTDSGPVGQVWIDEWLARTSRFGADLDPPSKGD